MFHSQKKRNPPPISSDALAAASAVGRAFSNLSTRNTPTYSSNHTNSRSSLPSRRYSTVSIAHGPPPLKTGRSQRSSRIFSSPSHSRMNSTISVDRTISLPSRSNRPSSSNVRDDYRRHAQETFDDFGDEVPNQQQMVTKYIPGPNGLVAVEVPVQLIERQRNHSIMRKSRNSHICRSSSTREMRYSSLDSSQASSRHSREKVSYSKMGRDRQQRNRRPQTSHYSLMDTSSRELSKPRSIQRRTPSSSSRSSSTGNSSVIKRKLKQSALNLKKKSSVSFTDQPKTIRNEYQFDDQFDDRFDES